MPQRQAVSETINERGDLVKVVQVGARAPIEITQALGALDTDNLAGEASTAGGHSVFFGVVYAEALANQRRAKLQVEVVKAQLGRRLRANALRDAAKITERSIEEEIILSDEYQRAEGAHINAEEMSNILRSVVTASEQKHKIVGSLGTQVGRELDARRGPVTGAEMRALMQDAPRGGRP